MKALRTIQTLFKIARVICIIVFICGIIGAASCALTLLVVPSLPEIEVEGFNFEELLAENGLTMGLMYGALSVAILGCVLAIVLSKYTQKFCEKELEIGTPFNMDVVKRMRKLALFQIIASISVSFVSGLVMGIIASLEGIDYNYDINILSTIGFGISLLILSLFCEAGIGDSGAQLPQKNKEVLEAFDKEIDVLSD